MSGWRETSGEVFSENEKFLEEYTEIDPTCTWDPRRNEVPLEVSHFFGTDGTTLRLKRHVEVVRARNRAFEEAMGFESERKKIERELKESDG
jgi:hypothetical protein